VPSRDYARNGPADKQRTCDKWRSSGYDSLSHILTTPVMAENKTKATAASVPAYFAKITNAGRRSDCEALAALMTKVTKQPAVMWGPSIVGFGSYHYVYESGREGDSCVIGFSSRASEIALYLGSEYPKRDELLAKLGKHKTAKGCMYIKTLAEVDLKVLEQMIKASYAHTVKRWS
jgi:hypothetical protein